MRRGRVSQPLRLRRVPRRAPYPTACPGAEGALVACSEAVDRRWRYATTTTATIPRCPRCLLRDGVRARQATVPGDQAGTHSSCGTCRPYGWAHHLPGGPPSSPAVDGSPLSVRQVSGHVVEG